MNNEANFHYLEYDNAKDVKDLEDKTSFLNILKSEINEKLFIDALSVYKNEIIEKLIISYVKS